MSNATTAARLLAAKLSVPRFRGRAALFRLAERGDTSALDALEASPQMRERMALRQELSPQAIQALKLELETSGVSG